jgi:Flp pilus assembly protein TadD
MRRRRRCCAPAGGWGRQDFTGARDLLDAAIAVAPQAVWPRVVRSHVLLREGRDWAGAERALRDVLALDPRHAKARRNLAVLLQRAGTPGS